MRFLVDVTPQRKTQLDRVKEMCKERGLRVPSVPCIVDDCIGAGLPIVIDNLGINNAAKLPKKTK